METATTILNQLGGHRFIAMTGAKNFGIMSKERGIAFTIPLKKGNIRGIRIYLNSLDLYDMQFLNRRFEVIGEIKNIYNDQLQEVFTNYTGLNTRL